MKKKLKGFTLIEMLVVLFVISVLILLFLPNVNKQQEKVETTSNTAIVKIVDNQIELYKLDNNTTERPTLDELVQKKYITEEQKDKYEKAPKP